MSKKIVNKTKPQLAETQSSFKKKKGIQNNILTIKNLTKKIEGTRYMLHFKILRKPLIVS